MHGWGCFQAWRVAEEVTLFKSLGLAVEDVTTAELVYHKTLEEVAIEDLSTHLRR